MSVKQIFDEISSDGGSNAKMEILAQYKDDALLRRVLYLANSKRVKFYIKQIPIYDNSNKNIPLSEALDLLDSLSSRNVTGHGAVNHLSNILSSVNDDDAYIIERIIEKDCKIGMGTTNINKIFAKLIEKTPYMGAKSYKKELVVKLLAAGPARSDMKMDGRYGNAIIREGEVELESRQGEPNILTGSIFIDELSKFPNCVLNGELTMDNVSRYESNGIIASLISIKGKEANGNDISKEIAKFENENDMTISEALANVRYTVWDTITIEEYFQKKSTIPYDDRRSNVQKYISGSNSIMVSLVESVEINSFEEAMEHFQNLINQGHEGTILKSCKGTWKDGKPNWQIKLKLEIEMELRIVGFNYGSGKNSDVISSVDTISEDGLLKTSPTGIKESEMQYITTHQEELLGTIIKAKCSGVSRDSEGNYSLLHPVYVERRDDKDSADTLPQILDIEAMAKGLK